MTGLRAASLSAMGLALAACAAPSPFDQLASAHPCAVVAHRGASAARPENTLAAFRRAVEVGAPVVEFDVYQSADGAWVCMHDGTLDRTTDAAARLGRSGVRVHELTFAELRRLDAGSWFGPDWAGERVASLEQALRAIAPAIPMIERKGGDALALVAELRRLDVVDRVIVQSFDWDWLEQVHRAEPRLLLGALGGDDPTEQRLQDLDRTGARIVHWQHRRLTAAAARQVLAGGRLLCAYTVDDEAAFRRCLELGCRMVTTNRPQHFVRWLRRPAAQR
ncbi:MAG: glycerophosphodiester phosphodiesterase [Planctomycetes bacterium]|nr:glycerophosphodiester phosphodiesterase [Planctomycetota bacterium]